MAAACGTSPDPVLYTLQPVGGTARGGGPHSVVLHEIGLAKYLDRPQIVRASGDYQLDISRGDWWGEPLGRMIGRVLADELSQRLPGTSVFSETGAINPDSDVALAVNILGFAADRSGAVVLSAQAAVERAGHRGTPRTTSVRISVVPTSSGVRGQVAAMSTALGQFADTIASLLRS